MTENNVSFEIDKDSQELTYVLFRDNWCSLCRDIWYILKEIKSKGIPVYEIDVPKNLDLIEKYSIEQIPTVIIFQKGRIVDFIVGKHSKNKYLSHARLFFII